MELLSAGALQSTGPPQAATSDPTVHAQATATTAGSAQPLADPADPAVPLEQAATVPPEAAQPETTSSLSLGGLPSS